MSAGTSMTDSPASAKDQKADHKAGMSDDDDSHPNASIEAAVREVTPLQRFTLEKYIAKGSYGAVFSAHVIDKTQPENRGLKVAIKRMTNIFRLPTHAKRLLREIRILRNLQHVNLIRRVACFAPHGAKRDDYKTLYLATEFMATDLARLLKSDQFFSELHVQFFLYQVLCGLKYLHSAQIMHRDLKPANILVNADCSLKICDFGLARVLSDAVDAKRAPAPAPAPAAAQAQAQQGKPADPPKKMMRQHTQHVVTRWYRAPEVCLMSKNYTTAVDIWSVGCIFAELFGMQKENVPNREARGALFPGGSCFPLSNSQDTAKERFDQLNVILDSIGSPTPNEISRVPDPGARDYLRRMPQRHRCNWRQKFPGVSDHGIDLLDRMLVFDPLKRITAAEALQHPYLAAVREADRESVWVGDHKELLASFAFEQSDLGINQIRDLIWEEVVQDNPSLANPAPAAAGDAAAAAAAPASDDKKGSAQKRKGPEDESQDSKRMKK